MHNLTSLYLVAVATDPERLCPLDGKERTVGRLFQISICKRVVSNP